MEKRSENKLEELKSKITLENRKKLILTGVEEVISFDEEKILLNTNLGFLTIKGSDLKMNKLNLENNELVVEGRIIALVYSETDAMKKSGMFGKIFK